jgi:hypothetical protein
MTMSHRRPAMKSKPKIKPAFVIKNNIAWGEMWPKGRIGNYTSTKEKPEQFRIIAIPLAEYRRLRKIERAAKETISVYGKENDLGDHSETSAAITKLEKAVVHAKK